MSTSHTTRETTATPIHGDPTMNTRITRTLTVMLAVALMAGTASAATINTDFTEASLAAAGVSTDVPNGAVASATLDDPNDRLVLAATASTDMWFTRSDAPFAYILSPAGSSWFIETEVEFGTDSAGKVAGITVYGNANNTRPEFTLGLDNWAGSGAGLVHLQGLGGGAPTTSVGTTDQRVTLRLEFEQDAGAGGLDRYTAYYDLGSGGGQQLLGFHDEDVANARAAMFLKTNTANDAWFHSFEVGTAAAPTTMDMDVIKWDFEDNNLGDTGQTNFFEASTLDGTGALDFYTDGTESQPIPYANTDAVNANGDTFLVRTDHQDNAGTITKEGDGATGFADSAAFTLPSGADLLALVLSADMAGDGGVLELRLNSDDSVLATLDPALQSVTLANIDVDILAHAGLEVYLRITDDSAGGWGHVAIDNILIQKTISLVAIPTPAALPAGLAMIGLLAIRRRR